MQVYECPECGGYYHRHEDTIFGVNVEYYKCHECGDEVWLMDDDECPVCGAEGTCSNCEGTGFQWWQMTEPEPRP